MLYLQISKHSPESCPLHHEKAKKANIDLMANMERLQKKHRIKEIGSWHSMPNHLLVAVFDAPSIERARLMLDEPTSGLDAMARRKVWAVLREMVGEGRTTLLTTHMMEEARALKSARKPSASPSTCYNAHYI